MFQYLLKKLKVESDATWDDDVCQKLYLQNYNHRLESRDQMVHQEYDIILIDKIILNYYRWK